MDESAQGLDPDYLMDLDEAEGSDLDDDEDELIADPRPSPFHFPSSGSAATLAASSLLNGDDFPLPFGFSGKPFSNINRGRGRPRRERVERHFEPGTFSRLTGILMGKPAHRRSATGNRIRKVKPSGYPRKKVKGHDRMDFDFSCLTPLSDELSLLDHDAAALIFAEKGRSAPIFELPYFPEQWPGKVCALCNLGEKSQLGQGEMLRLLCPEGVTPQRVTTDVVTISTPERENEDKSPRGPVTCRRQKSFNKCRHPSLASECLDELTIIGYTEEPHISTLFDVTGYFYIHRNCASWSYGVIKNEKSALENVGPAVLQSSSRKCSFCNHYGASIFCSVNECSKVFHFPCVTASGAFQVLNSLSSFCSNHIGQASLECENTACYTCKLLGDISNLMYCSSCGAHYHGTCVGLAQLPGVRAGWQCRKCRVCQVCRMTGDETKLMTCEQCDKIYHSTCQRPIVTSIPKYGWKCRCCRVCGDCGSRTPGAGLSSRWHAHYTVCDSCYQQRNKGFSCPLCRRAYRAQAHREMVQCTLCRKFVHGTCDPEADLITYHQKKEAHPDYEYICLLCKNLTQPTSLLSKRNCIDDFKDCPSAPQEYDAHAEFDTSHPVEVIRNMGLGKGKPYSSSKIARKRLGLNGMGTIGRPKEKGVPGKMCYMKKQKMTDFRRRRGAKAKMRGVFGVPGVGLQRPISDGRNDEEPGVENRLVLCSAKDKYVLTQDTCVMCGALGTDQEGCLISCVQCGQCYHPYCINVKVTKVILQKGWRCLDCAVCEGCGQRNDEARLILCDDCDISYHIYCMDPPLVYVPHGNWKCKWCAVCQTCGTTDPGFNCMWMNSFTECGPCASHVTCPECSEPYNDGDLIIQCVQCDRWLHGTCDGIKTEEDAEKCAEEGYNCLLCRPRDVPPPHLEPTATTLKPPTSIKSSEVKSNNTFFIDGVYLSKNGFNLMKSLSVEQNGPRKKRKKITTILDKEAGIMATIESVVAGGSCDTMLEDSAKLDLVEIKDEPQEIYKEGMMWIKDDGPPPEGFTVFTMESGATILRRKRQRNLQKMGIGGFLVRMRGIRWGQDNEEIDLLPGKPSPFGYEAYLPHLSIENEKPRKKPGRRKPKSKLTEAFPPYLQEAFFGKDILDSAKEVDNSSSDEEKGVSVIDKTMDEIRAVNALTTERGVGVSVENKKGIEENFVNRGQILCKKEEEESTEDLKDVLALPGDLDTDLVNTIMNEDHAELDKNTESLVVEPTNLSDNTEITNTLENRNTSKDTKDELTDILGNFSLETMPSINGKDVEDIFKGVLTDDSQESQENNVFPIDNAQSMPQHQVAAPRVRSAALPPVNQSNVNSPVNFPPQSPYQSEYSNSPQFSPVFSEPPSPWVSGNDSNDVDPAPTGTQSTYNQRSSEKMKADEGLGNGATISAVLYANMNHVEWKSEFPNWSDRYKQILKKWRTLSSDQKAPYLQQARDNRSALRMKKQQQSQITKDTSAMTSKAPSPTAAPISHDISSTQVPAVVAPVSEVCTQPSRPTPSLTTASTSSVSVSPPVVPHLISLTSSLATQQRFTVHGQFLRPSDHCGPAPNVTVNPLYQPNVANEQIPHLPLLGTNNIQQQTTAPASDQQIRVLTPSEIMRTLPSLCQENYEPQSLDQEISLQHKSSCEEEQERQWKQLQASRQQQVQQQQNIIQEQRFQSIARVQRQMSDPTPFPFLQERNSQGLSPVTSPSSNPRQMLTMGIKSTFTHPTTTLQHLPPSHTPLEMTPDTDSYVTSPPTPTLSHPNFPPRVPPDPYAQQPSTPRPQFQIRPPLQGINASLQTGEAPELNRQLRDLLQRQQFKKLDDRLLAGKGQQRLWPPTETSQEVDTPVVSSNAVSSTDTTFRQPLPPSIPRPRMPVPGSSILRQPGPHLGLRMQLDPRIQGLDPRMKLLLEQQQQRLLQQATAVGHSQQQQQVSSPAFVRPTTVEQYEQSIPRQQAAFQSRTAEPRLPTSHLPNTQRPPLSQAPAVSTSVTNPESTVTNQEIPDNVTAELEKLEQETGTIAELQAVGDILGSLGDDDDELLAEMGADFNILEYADPEALPGEKTNILDLELEEEPLKNDKKVKVELSKTPGGVELKKEVVTPPATFVNSSPQTLSNNIHQPALAIAQGQSNHPLAAGVTTHLTVQQIHQQMLLQVQQAAARGKPMPPGSRLQTPDGIIGIVNQNNTVQLQIPQSYHQRLLVSQLQNQKLQIRLGQNGPRIRSVAPVGAVQQPQAGLTPGPKLATPPPPPPYPGPPPPYPGSTTPQQQMGLRMGPVHLPLGHIHPMRPQGLPLHPHLHRRPLLLEEQPLLLEDLLEQEKREQEKQNQNQSVPSNQETVSSSASSMDQKSSVLVDQDFKRITNALGPVCIDTSPRRNEVTSTSTPTAWQQNQNRPKPVPTPQLTAEIRVQTFNANLLAPPPLPPENIVTEQDKQKQLLYEQWLSHQNSTLTQQLKYYETEVNKLRKMRKSLNSKQRQLRKTGGQLADFDAKELQRISAQQSILQKHLESSRKLNRQHGLLIQEYRTKQQPGPGQSPLLIQQNHSPLGPPSSSPIHASQSPMMSPSASPLIQQNSPLHSPSPMLSYSPGVGSVNTILQSPSRMSPMQPSPLIGTPQSQGDSSPSPAPSPSQICLPPPASRMTSPQHKSTVISHVGYTSDLKPGTPQMRFVRTPLEHAGGLQRRLTSPINLFQQKSGTPSPLSANNPAPVSTPSPMSTNTPMPIPPQFEYYKLGLRGGAPMWSFGRGAKRIPTPPGTNKEPEKTTAGECSNPIKPKKESHLSKVSILKRKSPAKTNLQSLAVSKVGSLVSTDYNEFDDSSCTPPVTPPPVCLTSASRISTIQKSVGKKIPEAPDNKEVLIVHSPEEKQMRCDDIMDYDDDNNTVISGEVSLSSAAQQNDGDDIAVIESLAQSDLVEPMSSPLESDQIADEYLLFPGNMVVDLSGEAHYSDKEEAEEEDYGGEDMHVVIRSPTTSDDEFIMQNKTKKYNIRRLPSNHLLDSADSPEAEEVQTDPSPEAADEDAISNYEESEIVIIDPSAKSPDEQISTKEDFEELIDEGSRKDKIMKQEVITKHINEIHKYAANVYSFPSKSDTNVPNANPTRVTNLLASKLGQKFSLITPVVTISRSESSKGNDVTVAQNSKLVNTTTTSKLTNIILHSAVRTNVLSVPKLVTSGNSAITIVSANPSPIASILPSGFTVPVISASAVRQLPNVKVIDKPSSSISLTTHDSCLPKKIFEDDSVSPDSSNCEDDKSKDSSDEKSKSDSPPADFVKQSPFVKVKENLKSDLKKLASEFPQTTSALTENIPTTVTDIAASYNSDVKPAIKQESKVETNIDPELKKVDNVHVSNIKVHNPRVSSPIISKTSSPVIIHNTPELKMTAQVIQESQSGIHITARAETVDGFEGNSGDDTKSVVISIPSPTPSQEQMLDNIALQALENRRRDGNGIPSEFESFEDVLDMIENITGKPPTVLEDNIKDKLLNETDYPKPNKANVSAPEKSVEIPTTKTENKIPPVKPSVVPQLSPLSQPTDLTTNMANASQQLRTLLSLATTTTSSNIVESVVKTVNQKMINTGPKQPTPPVVTSRIIQQSTTPVNIGTVIVPNMKPKTVVTTISPIRTQSTTVQSPTLLTNTTNAQITTTGLSFLPGRSAGIQLMPEHPKLPRVAAINTTASSVSLIPPVSTVQQSVVLVTTTSLNESVEAAPRKTTCSLTEMLQSHPAAVPTTKTSADTITAASLLGTSIGLSRSGFSTSLVQAQPHVVVSPVTTSNTAFHTTSFGIHSTNSITTTSVFKSVTSNTNLLHTQLTKVIRHKSLEETLIDSTKSEDIKMETVDTTEEKTIKLEQSGCKLSSLPTPSVSRNEDSQNALLKKLLQNTACANTQTPSPAPTPTSVTVAASTQFTSSLESQLKASILTPVVKETVSVQPQVKPPVQKTPIMNRETSFVSSPVIQQPQTSTSGATQQLHIDIKKCLPPSRTPSRDDLLSPPTPRSSCSQDSSLQTPPLIKKEIIQPLQQPLSQEVKKEYVDETSQHSEVSDQSRSDVPMKEELDALDPITEKLLMDKEELKKQKRRMYQQKRRQNQIMNKETVGQPKKRPRKSSKVDEDYDTYIESVLAQLRSLPSMVVSEPVLNRNFNILPVFGSDLNKLAANDYDSRFGELKGEYGNAYLPGFSDFYNTQPYGDQEPLPEKPPASTQRGFYDQEFPLIKFDTEEDKRFDMFCRDDSPESVISSSSPECPVIEPPHKFLGLKLINEDDDDEEEEDVSKMRLSPVVPIVTPVPIRLKPAGPYLKDYTEDKENVGREVCLKSKFASTPTTPLKDSGNVTVTLTLTSSAAEDIMGVLRDLANILHIPAPTSYQIVERTSTPPSQKLGLYRTKGKDGKEGAPIDIQSILNGAAKFCKHCDVVILNNMIRKKVSELPFLSKDSELLSDGDELFFCSTTCYMQFALMHRSPSIPEDKAAAIIDHLCHKDRADLKAKRPFIDSMGHKKGLGDTVDMELHHFKKEIEPMDVNEIKAYSMFTKQVDVIRMRKYDDVPMQSTPKVWKGTRYKSWTPGCLQPPTRHKKPTDKETMELLYRMGITVAPMKLSEDYRKCMFCQGVGDGVADGPARLLNFDVDKWVHLNCGLWSDGVYETVNGALMNLENALQQSLTQVCVHCSKLGATVRCFKTRCSNVYHLSCAVKDGCVFYKNKTTYCTVHILKNEKDNELTTLSVSRRVYVNRDENRQVAAVMHHSDTNNLLRVGSLIFLSVGQLLPHQLQNFHNQNYIYPIGYKIIRFYWSMRHINKRCKYICSIHESFGKPEFKVVIQEGVEEDVEFKDISPKAVWHRILAQIASMRRENQCIHIFPQFVSGEDLFGLTEPAVVRVLESLPGIETLTDYKFKYGRNPLLELPLAINPSGAARTEPRSRSQLHWKRPHTQRTAGSSVRPLFGPTPALTNNNTLAEGACPYTKQFVHSKSSQYKKMKQEWRNNVYLARSKIQGLGLYAARDLEKHTMVIEYIGEIIRTELAETREKKYEAKNRGIYMFRLDEERVVDATLSGGLARYINHSCNPNCVAETVEVDRDYRIIIFAKRRIQRGEELAYDYKFDIEDDQHKISCMCGAPNCRKWMN